jgi:molybdopterin molybdotransferase
MLDFNKAFKIIMEQVKPIELMENVELLDSVGRVLGEDIFSDRALPPFNRVAMDGFALKRVDISKELEIIETIAAGSFPSKIIKSGQCSKVMTGCKLPEGADMVLMVEYSQVNDNKMKFNGEFEKINNDNYCKTGEDKQKGGLIVKKGTLLDTNHMGVMAACGYAKVKVVKKPVVGVIATGDEIIEPGEIPNEVQIRNSNSYQLISQLRKMGVSDKYYGIIEDVPEKIYEIIKLGKKECDLILITGGVSMGEFDFVPLALKKNDFKILFDRLAIKPGKPTTFSVSENEYCFGLPGNPVASYSIFEIMVKPFLYNLLGHDYSAKSVELLLKESVERKKGDRDE